MARGKANRISNLQSLNSKSWARNHHISFEALADEMLYGIDRSRWRDIIGERYTRALFEKSAIECQTYVELDTWKLGLKQWRPTGNSMSAGFAG